MPESRFHEWHRLNGRSAIAAEALLLYAPLFVTTVLVILISVRISTLQKLSISAVRSKLLHVLPILRWPTHPRRGCRMDEGLHHDYQGVYVKRSNGIASFPRRKPMSLDMSLRQVGNLLSPRAILKPCRCPRKVIGAGSLGQTVWD